MERTLERSAIYDFKRATEEKLHDITCPDHGQRPRVRVTGISLREATVSLSGCCDKLMALANVAIANP